MTDTLSPFVYWAQTENNISLKVDLKDAKDTDISLSPTSLKFSGFGQGAKGSHRYGFCLDFHSPVCPEGSNYKVFDSKIDFILKKEEKGWWPRLIGKPLKPAWLKIDFDKWQSEEDIEESNRDLQTDYPDIYNKVFKEEYGYIKEEFKRVYLTIYNLLMFIGFLYISIVMFVRYMRDGPDSMPGTYNAVGGAFKFIQLFQWLEVMHPLFGYVKGGVFAPFMQTFGRTIVLFCLIEFEPRMQPKPVVFYLFVVWSTIELVRYPYYLTQVYKRDIGFITWLRYTIWIPLYPLGFLCEGIIVLRDIPYFEETQRFSIFLPNSYNFSFHFATFLRMYLLFLILPMMYVLMSHMYKVRVKKLGPKSWKKNFD